MRGCSEADDVRGREAAIKRVPLPPPAICGVCEADELPAAGGAYALLILSTRSVVLPRRCGADRLAPGRYVYFGSALGGGGIRARCRRHLLADKSIRWHVDRLTVGAPAGDIRALAFPDATECALCARVLETVAMAAPVSGFGSSDCSVCPAHLCSLSEDVPWERVVAALQNGEG